ncbi:MAG: hypothetical protein A2937_01185 [Candidatus Yonathbacteria bacterium RIFCSPLOWO2_01_FULL_47_33b]|uniref:Type 4 fimbrial biogenesis protein PilX N-terminal domain-containing protein n=1 Tax=Candidatus Yonathbacteria bacterium RIFCSPLOWO2_01_FULL_47_33b TaxID=1802727 RepID=A0A1G2SH44_9BACT|nr:MAG: hypothetical protein A2937_01185 [Candidatus Yonathbacteria bacterium RIFCSPLOWO2_01_FULL_47_33b]
MIHNHPTGSSEKGAAIVTFVLFFVIVSLAVVIGISTPIAREARTAGDFIRSKSSYYLAESGSEDVLYRIKNSKQVSPTEVLVLGGNSVTTTLTTVASNERSIFSTGSVGGNTRKVQTNVTTSSGAAFSFGVQAGDGGVIMENSSSISGNVYSSGPISRTGTGVITGDAISAGPTGSVSGVNVTGSVYAHTITSSTIGTDAHYQTISSSSVSGVSYPGSTDQDTSALPISDALITQWETDAATGGTISSPCPYKITGSTTIGPKKINCDLEIATNGTITLGGGIWVSGNITIKNNPTIKVDPAIGGQSVALIADNTTNRLTSSTVSIENGPTFVGSGTAGSYILFVSQNNSAETGGGTKAIEVENTANGALLVYAGHGEVVLKNSIALKEVTAYRLRLQNTANVTYESGLASLLFSSGPGGSWTVKDWFEVE